MKSSKRPLKPAAISVTLLKRGYKAAAVEKVLGRTFTDALGRIWRD